MSSSRMKSRTINKPMLTAGKMFVTTNMHSIQDPDIKMLPNFLIVSEIRLFIP
jgi:hypothetical protein